MVYNIMTCTGKDWSAAILGDCSLAWFSIAITLFLILIVRRQCEDGLLSGTGFNIFGAFGLGLGLNVLLITLTGSARWSFIGGIAGLIVGGVVIGMFMDTSREGGE